MGKVPVRRERLTTYRIVGPISLAISLRTAVELGLRLQCKLGDWESKFTISDRVAGVKWRSIGKSVVGKK